MASPQQRPDPSWPEKSESNRGPAEIREIPARAPQPRGGGAGWFAWWWIWLAVILCAIWFAGWGWSGYGGWWRVNRGGYPGARGGSAGTGLAANGAASSAVGAAHGPAGAAMNMNLVTGPGAAALLATRKQSFIGQRFQVNDAVVMRKVNDHVFWIGQSLNNDGSTAMLVVVAGAARGAGQIAQGDLVNVTGKVRRAPAAARAERWHLSADGEGRLEREGAYVRATQVERAESGSNG